MKVVQMRWRLRAQPKRGRLAAADEERLMLDLDGESYKVFVAERGRVFDGERFTVPEPERSPEMNVMHTLAEFAHFFPGSRMLSDDEAVARGFYDEPSVPVEARTETLARMEDMEARGFKIPAAAKEAVAQGQTSLLSSPPPPHAYRDADDGLPSPDGAGIGKFHAPEHGAPETQRRAAVLVYPRTGTQRRKVLDFIAAAGERGATDEEAAAALGMLANTQRPRRVELEEDGWVIDSGKRRETAASQSRAAVWVLSEAGRAQWRPAEEAVSR